ncbi:MAG: HD domain-containing phosphohydrolase [Thermodesulfobacteriota bacterium]
MSIERGKYNAIERLHHEAQDTKYQSYIHDSDRLVVVISGLNNTSKAALLNRERIIRHFPHTIGRYSPSKGFIYKGADLIINERSPYRISRQHLSIERRGDQIILVDKNSKFGSLVNNTLLGKNVGGKEETSLRYGQNEVILGGQNSPFAFHMKVIKSDNIDLFYNYVKLGDHLVSVAELYIRFCHITSEILTSSNYGTNDRIEKVLDVITGIVAYAENIDMLYYYSAHPDTFEDLIVAHSVNVAIYAIKMAFSLSYSKDDTIIIGIAALLHDIGMYDIPNRIINKKKVISDKEYNVMKKHTKIGYDKLLEVKDEYRIIPKVAFEHHERVDGSGYPKGLRGISDISELIGMVDFFEAVTHSRPQRGPVTPHEGVKMLLGMKHEVFSIDMIKAFFNVFSFFPVYSVVRLNSGEIGQVVKGNINWPLRPFIRILFKNDGQPIEKKKEIDLLHDNNIFITKDISDRIFIDNYFKLY